MIGWSVIWPQAQDLSSILWLVSCLVSGLNPGFWLVSYMASRQSPSFSLVSPGYLCHRGRGGRSWRLFAWSSASESLVLTTFCCCVLTLSLLSLLLEVLHEEVESEVAENRYFVTDTILSPGIQPLGSCDLVDDHQLLCLVSHVTLEHSKIVNQIF